MCKIEYATNKNSLPFRLYFSCTKVLEDQNSVSAEFFMRSDFIGYLICQTFNEAFALMAPHYTLKPKGKKIKKTR